MKRKFESSLRMVFSITNIFLAVFGILIVTLSSFIIADSSIFIPVLNQDNNLNGYSSSAVVWVVGGVALFILGAMGLFSSLKSRYFIVSLLIYMISLVVVGLLLLSAVPISFVFYASMNAYLEQNLSTPFNASSTAYNHSSFNTLESGLSCCGVIKYTDYVNNNISIPTSCECIKSKPDCTTVPIANSNMLFHTYVEGCQTRLRATNQMQALLGGLTAGILCIEIFLLAVSPILIYLNYK